ncbi:Uncharacterised protein [Vibrio cholerae]|nr:Uncharacterised protein [Vibrio cholerae]
MLLFVVNRQNASERVIPRLLWVFELRFDLLTQSGQYRATVQSNN